MKGRSVLTYLNGAQRVPFRLKLARSKAPIMSYAAVMVHVGVAGEMSAHVKVAAALADRFRARLTGISGWASTSVFFAEEALQDDSAKRSPL